MSKEVIIALLSVIVVFYISRDMKRSIDKRIEDATKNIREDNYE